MTKQSDEYRLQMLRRLEKKNRQPDPPEVLEAQHVVAKFREEQAERGPQIRRASRSLQTSDICPACWILRGQENILLPVDHPDPDNFDRMKCKVCGYCEDGPA